MVKKQWIIISENRHVRKVTTWTVTLQKKEDILDFFYLCSLNSTDVVACQTFIQLSQHAYDHFTVQ